MRAERGEEEEAMREGVSEREREGERDFVGREEVQWTDESSSQTERTLGAVAGVAVAAEGAAEERRTLAEGAAAGAVAERDAVAERILDTDRDLEAASTSASSPA